jgi:hypothetical protein
MGLNVPPAPGAPPRTPGSLGEFDELVGAEVVGPLDWEFAVAVNSESVRMAAPAVLLKWLCVIVVLRSCPYNRSVGSVRPITGAEI